MNELQVQIPPERVAAVFGPCDENIKALEQSFSVLIIYRDDAIKIAGEEPNVQKAAEILKKMSVIAATEPVSLQHVRYLSQLNPTEAGKNVEELMSDVCGFTKSGKAIRPKTFGQKEYVKAISESTITFGVGPAGTGKTYLAMAMAVAAYKRDEITRIILTRPAIEAGERLGFLPGDLQSKIDPYLRPLYDALYDILGPEGATRMMERGVIEVAPLAYMRGRTLDNAFIILDEAQNTTQAQMKMFLTRMGYNSKVVVTGDLTQIDLPRDTGSGLVQAVRILEGIEGISIVRFSNNDVVRHPLVQRIVEAYESKQEKK